MAGIWLISNLRSLISRKMALKTFVKISGVNNLSDARYCAGMGVDIIGFDLDEGSDHYVSPSKFKEIERWISGVKLAGEFTQNNIEIIKKALQNYQLDYLQISDTNLLDTSGKVGIPIILKLEWDSGKTNILESIIQNQPSNPEYFLLNNDREPGIEIEEIGRLKKLCSEFPVLLGFGFSKPNIERLLSTISPGGIALKGARELKPGFYDFDEMAEILELLQEDD